MPNAQRTTSIAALSRGTAISSRLHTRNVCEAMSLLRFYSSVSGWARNQFASPRDSESHASQGGVRGTFPAMFLRESLSVGPRWCSGCVRKPAPPSDRPCQLGPQPLRHQRGGPSLVAITARHEEGADLSHLGDHVGTVGPTRNGVSDGKSGPVPDWSAVSAGPEPFLAKYVDYASKHRVPLPESWDGCPRAGKAADETRSE